MNRLAASLLTIVLVAAPSFCRTWHIEADGTGDAPTIQAGVDSAAVGDTVELADGTYTGAGNRDVDLGEKALLVRSASGPEWAILDCESAGRAFYVHEPGHVVIEGITIRNGTAERGGGIFIGGGSGSTVRGCRIHSCVATVYDGGGIRVAGNNNRVVSCLVSANTAAQSGGGIACGGGESSSAVIDSCLITGNRSDGYMGYQGGGGIWSSYLSGWGIEIRFCTIAGNRAASKGGGFAEDGSEYSYNHVTDTILRNNCAQEGSDAAGDGSTFIEWSDIDPAGVEGAYWDYPTMIFDDPLFCDPADCYLAPTLEGDYSLDAASPCLPANNPLGEWRIGALGEGCDATTGVADAGSLPAGEIGLFVSPNPSTGEVTFRFARGMAGPASIVVYDVRGRLVRSLAARGASGLATWDGRDRSGAAMPPGVYFVRITEGERSETRRLVLVR